MLKLHLGCIITDGVQLQWRKIIENRLRTTMNQDRLSWLTLLSIEYDLLSEPDLYTNSTVYPILVLLYILHTSSTVYPIH